MLRWLMFLRYFFRELRTELSETPDDAKLKAYFSEGITHFKYHKYEDAITCFQSAIDSATNVEKKAVGYANLGNAHYAAGDRVLAVTAFQTGLELDADNSDLHHDLGAVYLADKKYRLAIEHLDKAAASGSVDSVLLTNRGIAKRHTGDRKGARQDFKAALKLDPADQIAIAALSNLSMRYRLQAQPRTALPIEEVKHPAPCVKMKRD